MTAQELEHAEKRMQQKWYDLVMAEQTGAATPVLERMYNAYMQEVEENNRCSSDYEREHQVRACNLAMQALGVFYRRHLVLSTPQNQHGLAHDLQVRRNRIDITGNEQADVLVEDLLAQFAVPLIDVLVDDVAETVDILDRVGERRAQVTNHIFVACLFGCVEVLALLYIGQRPVFSERVQIANSIDEYDRSHPIAIQPGGENLRHSAAEADAHENDVSEIAVPQQVVEHVGLAPDGCVGGPGMIGLPESKHIDGVDRSLQTAQLGNIEWHDMLWQTTPPFY